MGVLLRLDVSELEDRQALRASTQFRSGIEDITGASTVDADTTRAGARGVAALGAFVLKLLPTTAVESLFNVIKSYVDRGTLLELEVEGSNKKLKLSAKNISLNDLQAFLQEAGVLA